MRIQNSLFFAVLLLSTFHIAEAQNDWQFGLVASPLVSWYNYDQPEIEKTGPRVGYELGGIAEYAFDKNERYVFGTGLIFSALGSYSEITSSEVLIKVRPRTYHLQIPASLRATVYQLNYFRFYTQVGVAPMIKVAEDLDWEIVDASGVIGDFPESPSTFDVQVSLGIGAEYSVGQHLAVLMGLQYQHGLIPVYDEGSTNFSVFGLRTGLLF